MTLRPAPLRPGDRVAVVSPSSPPFPERLRTGLDTLRAWGFDPVVMPHARDERGHLAGLDDDRLADLEAAFADPELRAVFVGRGGYGSTRLLDRLDWDVLASDPKPLVGFSDVTALSLAAWQRIGLVTIHGPFVGGLPTLDDRGVRRLQHLLTDPEPVRPLGGGGADPGIHPVAGGTAEGPLLGGNLATLCSLVGTADHPDLAGAVVFLEDVNEAPYRVDRMLTQLLRAGVLDGVHGVAVGRFVRCDPPMDRPSLTTDEVLDERLGGLGVPVLRGLPIGHFGRQLAVPVGVRVRLDADRGTLEALEPAVSPRGEARTSGP